MKKWHDKLAVPIAEFLTSTLFVVIVMISFMIGIVTHLNDVFDSWFLSIGFQCVVLIASVNSEILPKFTVKKVYDSTIEGPNKYRKVELPAIAVIMSLFMLFFISISFGSIDYINSGEWLNFTISITKAIATASMELMFSYLFNSRWNSDLLRINKKEEVKVEEYVAQKESSSQNYL